MATVSCSPEYVFRSKDPGTLRTVHTLLCLAEKAILLTTMKISRDDLRQPISYERVKSGSHTPFDLRPSPAVLVSACRKGSRTSREGIVGDLSVVCQSATKRRCGTIRSRRVRTETRSASRSRRGGASSVVSSSKVSFPEGMETFIPPGSGSPRQAA
jgi:hypothetical protein